MACFEVATPTVSLLLCSELGLADAQQWVAAFRQVADEATLSLAHAAGSANLPQAPQPQPQQQQQPPPPPPQPQPQPAPAGAEPAAARRQSEVEALLRRVDSRVPEDKHAAAVRLLRGSRADEKH
jgi:hypothetical protein